MNIAQKLKLAFYISGKNYLDSKGVDSSKWTCKYLPTTYGYTFSVYDDSTNRVMHINCIIDKQIAEFITQDSEIAAGLASIFKRL